MKKIFFILVLSLTTCFIFSQRLSENESDYYDPTQIGSHVLNVNLTGNETLSDSNTLNDAITDLSNRGGGTIIIKKVPNKDYIYLRGIKLCNKVHIKIAADVIVRPCVGGNRPRNINIFEIGRFSQVRDVAITTIKEDSFNPDDYFTVEIPGGNQERIKIVDIRSGYNFKISGIKVQDSQTIFSNIECNLANNHGRKKGELPAYGVVKNVKSYKNHVGYGVVQIRAGKNILFKNLDGEGGITLRIESGIPSRIESAEATIDSVAGRNLTVRNGDAAAVLSPHRINQGKIDLSGIKAFNSTNAIQIAAGFLDKKGGVDNYGVFSSDSYIDISQVSGGVGAQVKHKDIILYPCANQQKLKKTKGNDSGGESTIGSSLTVVRNGADSTNGTCKNGCYDVNLTLPDASNVSGTALGVDKMIVYQKKDIIPECDPSAISTKKKEKSAVRIYPNPTSKVINIKFDQLPAKKLLLTDVTGRKLLHLKAEESFNRNMQIDVDHLNEGLYFLVINNNSYALVKK